MADALRLFGLKAVVTGAASGIGEAVVRTLIKQGAEVLAVDSANSSIDTHFKSVRGVHSATVDLNAADVAGEIASVASEELGLVDILVCNLDFRIDAPIADGDDDALKALIQRRDERVAGICERMLPLMKNSPAGRIIVLGFNRSLFAVDGNDGYAKSEATLARLVRKHAAETAEFGINVNYIQPGAIMTPSSRRVFNADKSLRDFCIARSAAKRLGEPVDIAKVVLFLATDDSVFVSGTGIVADGGIAANQ